MTRQLVLVDPWLTAADALAIVTRRRGRHVAWLVREQRLAIDDLYSYIVR